MNTTHHFSDTAPSGQTDPSETYPPKSDVSSAVGLVGLAGLVLWILLCRNWPVLVETFGLSGPQEPLSGPYAALTGMALIGLLMAAWSVLVDKVHRRPSTGIDWTKRRPLSETRDISITKLAGLWITWALIGALYCLCRWYWDGQYLFAMDVLAAAAPPMVLLSIPYILWLDRVMIEPRDHSWHFGAMLIGREAWDVEQVKKHWRAWAIKGFFGAFMISILPGGFNNIVLADFGAMLNEPVWLGTTLIEFLFLVDVQIGTVGYLFTLRPLDAHIRSGNPFVAGWLAALVCYPPFAWGMLGTILNYQHSTADWSYWMQSYPALLWAWAGLLVLLTGAYAWATVIFGIRFSNLTYRGVLTNGPYRFTRHPAYLSKNLFWWCSVLPFLVTNGSFVDMVRNTFFLGCVSGIYYWRARTEEAHLLGEDPKYRAYYDWMGQHGLITAPLTKLARRFLPKPTGT